MDSYLKHTVEAFILSREAAVRSEATIACYRYSLESYGQFTPKWPPTTDAIRASLADCRVQGLSPFTIQDQGQADQLWTAGTESDGSMAGGSSLSGRVFTLRFCDPGRESDDPVCRSADCEAGCTTGGYRRGSDTLYSTPCFNVRRTRPRLHEQFSPLDRLDELVTAAGDEDFDLSDMQNLS